METLKYFFALSPGSNFSYYTEFLIFCAVVIVGAYALEFYIKRKRDENRTLKVMFGSLPGKLKWVGFVGLFLIANRYESIPYFSMRIWLYLDVLAFVWIASKSIYLLITKYPSQKSFYEKKQHHTEENKSKKVYTMKKKRK